MRKLNEIDSRRVLNALLAKQRSWEVDIVSSVQSAPTKLTFYLSDECHAQNVTFRFHIAELNGHVCQVGFILENGICENLEEWIEGGLEYFVDESLLFSEMYEDSLTKMLNVIQSNDYLTEVMNWMDNEVKENNPR